MWLSCVKRYSIAWVICKDKMFCKSTMVPSKSAKLSCRSDQDNFITNNKTKVAAF